MIPTTVPFDPPTKITESTSEEESAPEEESHPIPETEPASEEESDPIPVTEPASEEIIRPRPEPQHYHQKTARPAEVTFVKRAPTDKHTRSISGDRSREKVRPLRLKYKVLPKEELQKDPGQRHGHRQMRMEEGPKTKNERARAKIAKIMSRLYEDD